MSRAGKFLEEMEGTTPEKKPKGKGKFDLKLQEFHNCGKLDLMFDAGIKTNKKNEEKVKTKVESLLVEIGVKVNHLVLSGKHIHIQVESKDLAEATRKLSHAIEGKLKSNIIKEDLGE